MAAPQGLENSFTAVVTFHLQTTQWDECEEQQENSYYSDENTDDLVN